MGDERRTKAVPVAVDKRKRPNSPLGFDLANPTTCNEVEYTPDEQEFLLAMQQYKDRLKRPYPTWREVFRVFMSLGYSKQPAPSRMIDFLAQSGEEG